MYQYFYTPLIPKCSAKCSSTKNRQSYCPSCPNSFKGAIFMLETGYLEVQHSVWGGGTIDNKKR